MKWKKKLDSRGLTEVDISRITTYLNNKFEKDFSDTKALFENARILEKHELEVARSLVPNSNKDCAYDSFISMVAFGTPEAADMLIKSLINQYGVTTKNAFLEALTVLIGAKLGSQECSSMLDNYPVAEMDKLATECTEIIARNMNLLKKKIHIKWGEGIAFGKDFDKFLCANSDSEGYGSVLPTDAGCAMGFYSDWVQPLGVDESTSGCCTIM